MYIHNCIKIGEKIFGELETQINGMYDIERHIARLIGNCKLPCVRSGNAIDRSAAVYITLIGATRLDFDNAIVLESKLSFGTDLTTRQGQGLAKAKSANNTFEVRTVSNTNVSLTDVNVNQSYVIGSGTENKTVTIRDFIKVWSDGNGTSVLDINSLK